MADWVGEAVSAVDVLAVWDRAFVAVSPQRQLLRDDMKEARAAVAELIRQYELLLRGQRHTIEMLRGERRKDRAEIDAVAERLEPAAAALARCKGEGA